MLVTPLPSSTPSPYLVTQEHQDPTPAGLPLYSVTEQGHTASSQGHWLQRDLELNSPETQSSRRTPRHPHMHRARSPDLSTCQAPALQEFIRDAQEGGCRNGQGVGHF